MKVAIIFCCYNRKAMTKRCLMQLYSQIAEFQHDTFQVYVCDDSSTDGTVEMIEQDFPQVCLLKSDGNLYWCKSMHRGMQEAVKENYDAYLMVNDDVDFCDDALQTMLRNYCQAGRNCGIVGAIKAIGTEQYTYGGRNEDEELVLPEESNRECVWANWNCFLIDQEIVCKVGIIDGKYQHAWGDFDYSRRMQKAGYKIYVADQCVGRCDLNSAQGSFKDKTVKRTVRLQKLFSPKGMPFYSYMRYHIRIWGWQGIFRYLYGYMSVVGYILAGKEIE